MTRPSNPARLLAALADAGTLRIDHAETATGLDTRQISDAAAVLIRRGYAERPEIGRYAITAAGRQALADAVRLTSGPNGPGGAPKRRRDTLRARVWRALRISRKASLPELLVSASRSTDRAPESNVRRYLRALRRAGYIADLARREPGYSPTSNGHIKWLLLRDTGPVAPIVRSNGTLYDPNTGKALCLETGEEVA